MTDPRSAPVRTSATVELIHRAVSEGNTSLALAIFREHTPAERDRIAELIRSKLLRAARSQRGQ